MADTQAIRAVEAIYQHVDTHVRELLPPPPGPEVESVLMTLQGVVSGAGTFGGTTSSMSTGTGPCPSVAEFGGPVTASFFTGWQFAGRAAVPHGWTGMNVNFRRPADSNPGPMRYSFLIEDADQVYMEYPNNSLVSGLDSGESETFTITDTSLSSTTRNNARFVSLWGESSGTGGQGASTLYTFTVLASLTFTGTCQDVEISVPPAVSVIGTGVAGVWSFDYKARITGWYLQEFEGTSGSIVLALAKAPRGPSATFANIAGSAPPAISSGRYGEDAALVGWNDVIERGDVIRVSVTSAASFTRVLFGLRIRRLEP